MTLSQFLLLSTLAQGHPTNLPPWWAVVPSSPGSLTRIIEVDPAPSHPNPCGQAFRVVAGRSPGEPECIRLRR